jgi:PQQ enzyme repeat
VAVEKGTKGVISANFSGSGTGSSPAVANGVVYVGSGDVYALNARTGAKLWTYATGSYVWSSPAVVNGTPTERTFELSRRAVKGNAGRASQSGPKYSDFRPNLAGCRQCFHERAVSEVCYRRGSTVRRRILTLSLWIQNRSHMADGD